MVESLILDTVTLAWFSQKLLNGLNQNRVHSHFEKREFSEVTTTF